MFSFFGGIDLPESNTKLLTQVDILTFIFIKLNLVEGFQVKYKRKHKYIFVRINETYRCLRQRPITPQFKSYSSLTSFSWVYDQIVLLSSFCKKLNIMFLNKVIIFQVRNSWNLHIVESKYMSTYLLGVAVQTTLFHFVFKRA